MSPTLELPGTSAAGDCGCAKPGSRIVAEFLETSGAQGLPHSHGRSLYDHLIGTRAILRRWLQPEWLQDAGAVHSVYSTDAYRRQLIPWSRRDDVRTAVGERAERLAWLFCVLSRDAFWQAANALPRTAEAGISVTYADDKGAGEWVDRSEAYHLMLLHMANRAEQSRGPRGQPGTWLSRVSAIGAMLDPAETLVPPPFASCTRFVTPESEEQAKASYLSGLESSDPASAVDRLNRASQSVPWVAEPHIARAYLALQNGFLPEARQAIESGKTALVDLGVAWDNRLTYCGWRKLIELLESVLLGRNQLTGEIPAFDLSQGENMISLLQTAITTLAAPVPVAAVEIEPPHPEVEEPSTSPAQEATDLPVPGEERFHRYVDSLSRMRSVRESRIYPGLSSQPWYDPADFALARDLQAHFAEIRAELANLGGAGFHQEAEPINRTGAWDVYMLYERGRKHPEHTRQCPVTTALLEAHETVRTQAGLIYFSRLKSGTHIAPHRGPTNMRLRCHLGLQVPAGDCRMRVGDEARCWSEGECLVFDDHFEHEAWNYAGEDRIVLIADLWHPGLSPREVELLKGLHWYAFEIAKSLDRYWSANQRAARTEISIPANRRSG